MQRSIGRGAALTVLVVGVWRAASELLLRMRELRRGGVLEQRLRARRVRALERALARAGVSATTPMPAPRHHDGVLAAAVVTIGAERAIAAQDRRRAERELDRASGARISAWAVLLALGALGLTLVPLVRPLGDAAPWLALGAATLLIAAYVLARRR